MFKKVKGWCIRLHHLKHKTSLARGFTLIEILVASVVVFLVMFFIGSFFINIVNFKNFLDPLFETEFEIQIAIQEIIPSVQTMTFSNVGSYPIVQAATSTFTFFSDADGDGLIEQVRYFLDGNVLKRGIIKPSGSPLSYNLADEKIMEAIHNIVFISSTSSIFSYYDENFTGSEAPLSQPVDIARVRVIGVEISVKPDNGAAATSTTILKLTPRNLRSNI